MTATPNIETIYNYRELTSEEIDLVDGGCLPEAIFHAVGTIVSLVYGGAAAYTYGMSVKDGICR